jgi:transposase InsO family protein
MAPMRARGQHNGVARSFGRAPVDPLHRDRVPSRNHQDNYDGVGADRDERANRVDRLDEEPVRLVAEYVAARAENLKTDAAREAAWARFHHACDLFLRAFAAQRCCTCWSVEDRAQELWIVVIEKLWEHDPSRDRSAVGS